MGQDGRSSDGDDGAEKLPFGRWLIKLLIEKALGPVLVSAVTGAGAAATGWYAIGQYQVKDQVTAQVEVQDRVREVLEEAMKRARSSKPAMPAMPAVEQPGGEITIDQSDDVVMPTVDDIRELWLREIPENITQQQVADFPEEMIKAKLQMMESRKR